MRAHAVGQAAIDFCDSFGLHKSATFAQGLYGHEEAHKLAQCWAHRMQFWMDLWIERGMFSTSKFKASDESLHGRSDEVGELAAHTCEHVRRRPALVLSLHPRFDDE